MIMIPFSAYTDIPVKMRTLDRHDYRLRTTHTAVAVHQLYNAGIRGRFSNERTSIARPKRGSHTPGQWPHVRWAASCVMPWSANRSPTPPSPHTHQEQLAYNAPSRGVVRLSLQDPMSPGHASAVYFLLLPCVSPIHVYSHYSYRTLYLSLLRQALL